MWNGTNIIIVCEDLPNENIASRTSKILKDGFGKKLYVFEYSNRVEINVLMLLLMELNYPALKQPSLTRIKFYRENWGISGIDFELI